MKKYKHKITGNIAVETHSEQNYRVEVPQNFTIPKWIVENSTDWEEIEELCVPIGTKFKHEDKDINTIYKIEFINIEGAIVILWNNDFRSCYTIKEVNQFFKEGTWKIYEEKEYEIVSIKIQSGALVTYNSNGVCIDRSDNKNLIKHTIHLQSISFISSSIWAVKRLSDGEIFTIGDRITGTHSIIEPSQKFVTIQKININQCVNFNLWIDIETGSITDGSGSFKNIKHYKTPIFTTEDKIDIYEGDEYYCTNKEITSDSKTHHIPKASPSIILLNGFIRFSTKEKCQEYIDKNKYLLKTEDGVKKRKGDSVYIVWTHLEKPYLNRDLPTTLFSISSHCLYFHDIKNARTYIKMNKPIISYSELKHLKAQDKLNLTDILLFINNNDRFKV